MTRVGFIGTGRMGAPMVRRLIDAGHDVHALGRTPDKCTAISDLGAQAVTDLAGVAKGADAVVVCVFTDDQVGIPVAVEISNAETHRTDWGTNQMFAPELGQILRLFVPSQFPRFVDSLEPNHGIESTISVHVGQEIAIRIPFHWVYQLH